MLTVINLIKVIHVFVMFIFRIELGLTMIIANTYNIS